MTTNRGDDEIGKIYVGDADCSGVFVGTDKVFPPSPAEGFGFSGANIAATANTPLVFVSGLVTAYGSGDLGQFVDPSGTKLFVPSTGGAGVNRYDIPLNFSPSAIDSSPSNIANVATVNGTSRWVCPNGRHVWWRTGTSGAPAYTFRQTVFDDPWPDGGVDMDVQVATKIWDFGDSLTPRRCAVSHDGSWVVYSTEQDGGRLFASPISTPFNLHTIDEGLAIDLASRADISNELYPCATPHFSPDGKELLIAFNSNTSNRELNVKVFKLSTPHDVSSIALTPSQSFSLALCAVNPTGIGSGAEVFGQTSYGPTALFSADTKRVMFPIAQGANRYLASRSYV